MARPSIPLGAMAKKVRRPKRRRVYRLADVGVMDAIREYLDEQGIGYADLATSGRFTSERTTIYRALAGANTMTKTADDLLAGLGFELVAPAVAPVAPVQPVG